MYEKLRLHAEALKQQGKVFESQAWLALCACQERGPADDAHLFHGWDMEVRDTAVDTTITAVSRTDDRKRQIRRNDIADVRGTAPAWIVLTIGVGPIRYHVWELETDASLDISDAEYMELFQEPTLAWIDEPPPRVDPAAMAAEFTRLQKEEEQCATKSCSPMRET